MSDQIDTFTIGECSYKETEPGEYKNEEEYEGEMEDDLVETRSINTEYYSSEPEFDDDDSDSDQENFFPGWESLKPIQFGDIHSMEGELCVCRDSINLSGYLKLIEEMTSIVPTHENHICIIDNIIRSFNYIFSNTKNVINPYRLAFTDLFYRFRHELLFKALCLSFNLPLQHSDVSFKEYGIESNRTPDLIISSNNTLYIIEVTATSSIEKAAQSKGMDILGFESKYQKELDMFNEKGISSSYLPIFFDMNEPKNIYTLDQYNSIAKVFQENTPFRNLLFTIVQSLSGLTFNLKNALILPSSILFNTVINVAPNHDSLQFLYRKSKNLTPRNNYKEYVVSSQIYNKLHRDKQRFFWVLDHSSITDDKKVVFVIDSQNHRVTCSVNTLGKTINELRSLLYSNNNVELLKYIKIRSGGILIDSNSSEHGVHFYDKIENNSIEKEKLGTNISPLPLIAAHKESPFAGKFDISSYKEKIEIYTTSNYHCHYYDESYEDQIINSIVKFDKENDYEDVSVLPKGLLGTLKAKDIEIDEVFKEIRSDYIISNSVNDELPIKRLKMKSPFLLPMGDFNGTSYIDLNFKNLELINSLCDIVGEGNPYTKIILEAVKSDNYKMYSKVNPPTRSYLDLESQRFKISNKINQLQKELFKKGSIDSVMQLSKTKDENYRHKYLELKTEFNSVNKELNIIKKRTGMSQDISYLRLPTKSKNTDLRKFYEIEMSHFRDKKKQSTIEGVGIINNIDDDYQQDSKVFFNICEMLTEERGYNPDLLIDDNVYNDAVLLKDLKQLSINNYKALLNQTKDSALGHSCAFVSRLAHSLMFYSQLPFSSDYVRVDNLGYKNALLLVKGGKKIFKSKSSKLFRIIHPISEVVIPWYNKGHLNKGSYSFVKIRDITYVISPWIMLHESILTDSISFYPRVMSFVALNLNPELKLKQQFLKVSVNVLLSFHNRRKTEVMLANLRYILLSTLGDFTGVNQILNEFFDFNYDRFQSFLRNSILINYPGYFKTLNDLKQLDVTHDLTGKAKKKEINISDFNKSRLRNIFTGSVINSTEDLALMIYSTFLMTKAPYQKVVERSSNLKGILEINEYYKETVGVLMTPEEQTDKLNINLTEDLPEYSRKLFNNDFNFDAKFCVNVGCFVDNIYESQDDSEDIETQWIKILNKPWDEMATSTGLRGDYDKIEDFWGQKGYFVVYKELLNTPGFPDKLLEVFNSRATSDDRRKILKSLNEVYSQKLEVDREFLIFHAVDKVQWRGGREIYVMDIFTKVLQQPIEQFMSVLCKKLDNELISIPSDRRAQVIHHSIFEKDLPVQENLTWYLTLDCSKWAPKSVFIKFVMTILNMRCVPNSFKTHFMNYIEKLYKKRIYFNKSEVEVLLNNPKFKDLCERNLIKDEKVGGYYMEMPYSWVMGIFNYTSSFLHAANQKYISYLLMKTSLISYGEESSLVMFAHSDDSGGRLNVSSLKMAQRSLIIYEIFLKSCNHLLSKKKSVVSRIYFEILSVIYLFKKLLALLPKFLGGLRFLPTDKGPAQDMLQSYSKCIEVVVAGADFNIAYIVMKIYSMMVWRFYYNKEPTKLDYDRPLQYLGLPDAHPLFILLCGSDADIIRIFHNKVNLVDLVTFVNVFTETTDSDGPIKPLKFEIKVKGIKRGFEDYIEVFREQLKSWSIRNVNFHNTGLNTLSFLRKLNDSGFVGSLVNESTVRRISRGYFLRIGDSAMTKMGNVKLSKMMDAITLCQSYTQGIDSVKNLFSQILSPEDIESIEEDFQLSRDKSRRMLDLIKSTMKAPLKIYQYMDMLSMEGRKIEFKPKTLKPTLIQLVKSSQIFSVDFDPASLVSYMKEPDMHWALNNLRGLSMGSIELTRYMEKLGYDVDEVDPDVLLRVCRCFGRENTKNIYVYSRVPGEIRQIKTYSAFLTFLSVNSFQNKEIQGLTIKLSNKEVNKEYTSPFLIEEVYTVNNIISMISILIEKCGVDFVKNMPLKPLSDINWGGGSVSEFVNDHFQSLVETDVRYNIIKAQLHCLKVKLFDISTNAEFLNGSSYFTFLKSQKVRSGWYGKGEVYIHIDNNYYSFTLTNNNIDGVYTNRGGKLPLHHSEFIQDVMKDIGIELNTTKKVKFNLYNKQCFGIDQTGDYSVYKGRDLTSGFQATILDKRNDFIDFLDSYTIYSYHTDSIVIHKGFESYSNYRKINLLPVKKAELIPLIKMVLETGYFENKILNIGLSNFEDFIYTEILTEYGKDVVIDFDSFIDNYQSSKIYSIFKNVFDNDYSKINKQPLYSPLPASEGSLVRILIDYSAFTNDKIISAPVNLDSKMMQLRAEYSDNMTTLLGDKLSEYYKQIYTPSEIKEISDHYHNISKCEDIDSMRLSLIKLMTYWGYGSLVNNIKEFTLSRDNKNFKFFNIFNLTNVASQVYSELYPFVIKEINKLMIKWSPIISSLEVPIKYLQSYTNPLTFINDYCTEVCMGVYNLVTTNVRHSIYNIQYVNILLGLLIEEDFISELQINLSKNYILGSIPISWKLRYEFIATINVLKSLWQSRHKQDFEPDFLRKVQRYPDNIVHFKSLLKEFDIVTSPKDVHYNSFLNEEFISFILNRGELNIKDKTYRVSPKITKRSETSVFMESFLKHPAPLTAETIESSEFEDLTEEYYMDPIDDDTILSLMSEIPKPHYIKTSTKKLNIKDRKIITGVVKWVIDPFIANSTNKMRYYRQIGENIVVVSDTFLDTFRESFPNSGIRIANYSKALRNNCKTFLLHYSFHKEFYTPEFINEYLGGQEFFYDMNESKLIKDNISRNIDGTLKNPSSLGFYTTGVELTDETVLVEKEGYLEYVDIGVYEDEKKKKEDELNKNIKDKKGQLFDLSKKEEMRKYGSDEDIIKLEKMNKVNSLIDEINIEKIIDENSIKNLKNKYNTAIMRDRIPTSLLLLSTISEAEMIKINSEILNNSSGITASDQKKMFLAPENFGLGRGINRNDINPIKDKKTRAEIDSLSSDLSRQIGSNTLQISKSMKKIVDANYKMWVRLNKTTKTKFEQKNFLLTLFSSLCSNSFVSEDDSDDFIWQEIINKTTVYLSQEEESDDDEETISLIFNTIPGSRLLYRSAGT